MPEFLGDGLPIDTQDNYVPALTLGPASRVAQITLSVIASNPALIQAWRYLDKEKTKPQLELVERTIVGQSIGVVLRNCAGVQIRSATVGAPTTVVGELAYDTDILLEGGGVTSATISATGKTSTATQLNVQHNDSLVAAEGTIDFEDAGANAWTIADDAANTRVKITPPRIVTGRVAATGAVLGGTGFTITKGATGLYTINWTPAFVAVPDVVAIVDDAAAGFCWLTSNAAGSTGIETVSLAIAAADRAFNFLAFAVG